MFWLGLIVGLFIGSFFAMLGTALCMAAKEGDKPIERLCSGQPITRADALARSRQTILRAEQERFLVPEDLY